MTSDVNNNNNNNRHEGETIPLIRREDLLLFGYIRRIQAQLKSKSRRRSLLIQQHHQQNHRQSNAKPNTSITSIVPNSVIEQCRLFLGSDKDSFFTASSEPSVSVSQLLRFYSVGSALNVCTLKPASEDAYERVRYAYGTQVIKHGMRYHWKIKLIARDNTSDGCNIGIVVNSKFPMEFFWYHANGGYALYLPNASIYASNLDPYRVAGRTGPKVTQNYCFPASSPDSDSDSESVAVADSSPATKKRAIVDGDIIDMYLDMTEKANMTLSYALNGKHCGVAARVLDDEYRLGISLSYHKTEMQLMYSGDYSDYK